MARYRPQAQGVAVAEAEARACGQVVGRLLRTRLLQRTDDRARTREDTDGGRAEGLRVCEVLELLRGTEGARGRRRDRKRARFAEVPGRALRARRHVGSVARPRLDVAPQELRRGEPGRKALRVLGWRERRRARGNPR